MCPARKGGGSNWLEQGSFGDVNIHQIMKTIIRYDIGVAGRDLAVSRAGDNASGDLLHHEEVDTNEHLEPEKFSIGTGSIEKNGSLTL